MLNSTCMREHHSSKEVYTDPRPDPGADELTASNDRLSISGLFLENRKLLAYSYIIIVVLLFVKYFFSVNANFFIYNLVGF